MNRCHKTRNGWYLGLVVPISSIIELILYSLINIATVYLHSTQDSLKKNVLDGYGSKYLARI